MSSLIPKLQAYFRYSARQQYEAISVSPFTLFIQPGTPFKHQNYAIPDIPCAGDLAGPLAELRRYFRARRRLPRFEFIEDYAPDLPAALRAAGFIEEYRGPLMLCTPDTIQTVPDIPGLTITLLTRDAPADAVRDYIAVQRQGFDPNHSSPVTEADITDWLQNLGAGRAFLARLNGQAASAGQYTAPYEGLIELVGIATLEPFRRRGLATALTTQAVQTAFANGVELACLSAGDEAASRVYERVGFRQVATMLAYTDSEE
jgi:ribosomal protein S18 acetylase RimI-like enzyme